MARTLTQEQKARRSQKSREWRERNPDKVAINRQKERDIFKADPYARDVRNALARMRFAEKMADPEYRKFHADRTAKAKAKDRISLVCTYIISAAKKRAEKQGIPFDLDNYKNELRDRISLMTCELSGVALKSDAGGRQFNSVSLDRIDSKKGYVYGNVRVIAWCLNAAFGNWGESDFTAVVAAWMEKRKAEADA